MTSTYEVESDQQKCLLDDETCLAQYEVTTSDHIQSDHKDTESFIPTNDVIFQSDKDQCIEYEMPFMNIPNPVMWHTVEVRSVDGSQSVECPNLVEYTFPKCFELLQHLILYITLPKITIKPEFAGKRLIAWSPNVGNNVVKKATLRVSDGGTIETLDSHAIDFAAFVYNKQGEPKPRIHLYDAHSSLSPSTITLDQPWHYSLPENQGFPLFALKEGSCLVHGYEFDLDPLSFLQVQIYDYATKTFDTVLIADYLDTFDEISPLTVRVVSESISFLPLEVSNMLETLESGMTVTAIVPVECSAATECSWDEQEDSLRTESCADGCACCQSADAVCFKADINEERVLSLVWGIYDNHAAKLYNVKSHYLGDEVFHSTRTCRLKSLLSMSHRGIKLSKFQLDGFVTKDIIPTINNAMPVGGMHLYNFTKYISNGSTTSNLSSLGAELKIYVQESSMTNPESGDRKDRKDFKGFKGCKDDEDADEDADDEDEDEDEDEDADAGDDADAEAEAEEEEEEEEACMDATNISPCPKRQRMSSEGTSDLRYHAKCYGLVLKKYAVGEGENHLHLY